MREGSSLSRAASTHPAVPPPTTSTSKRCTCPAYAQTLASVAEVAAIEVSGLRKAYGETVAVDGVSFEVAPGEIFGILGPNGAGKTTTLEMIEGLTRPTPATSIVLGMHV